MAHNFRDLATELNIDVQEYVCKSGDDSNDGLTPDTPKKNIPLTSQRNYFTQVGAGVYDLGGQVIRRKLIADGKVIIRNGSITDQYSDARDIEFRDFYMDSEGLNNYIYFTNCIFVNCRAYIKVGYYRNCVFKDFPEIVVLEPHGNNYTNLYSCVFKNINFRGFVVHSDTTRRSVASFTDSYFDRDVTIRNPPLVREENVGDDVQLFKYNNFRGIFIFESEYFPDGVQRSYAIQDLYQGTPQDNGYPEGVEWISEQALRDAGYTGYLEGLQKALDTCMNREPLFNNIEKGDFTLQPGSPHIGAAENGIDNISGQPTAVSIINADHGIGNVEVIPSPEIDVTNPDAYQLKPGYTEGYIDYIQKVGTQPLTLGPITPISALNFNTDFPGGTLQNNNVPDSEPTTVQYPKIATTTGTATNTSTLIIAEHNISIGDWVRVKGEDREVTNIVGDTISVNEPFREIIEEGEQVFEGQEIFLGALRPNRLTFLLRTSLLDDKPEIDMGWDNNIEPVYDMAGKFLTQEWDKAPGYIIANGKVYGLGSPDRPLNTPSNEISCKWINIRVYIRNDYNN